MIFLIILRVLHLYSVKVELIGILDIMKNVNVHMYVHILVCVTRKTKYILNYPFLYFFFSLLLY